MRTRTLSGGIHTLIAWLPLLLVAAAIGWFLLGSLHFLEVRSLGTEFTIGNAESSNTFERITGTSTEERLQAALSSGDVATMEAELDALETEQARAAAAPGPAAH